MLSNAIFVVLVGFALSAPLETPLNQPQPQQQPSLAAQPPLNPIPPQQPMMVADQPQQQRPPITDQAQLEQLKLQQQVQQTTASAFLPNTVQQNRQQLFTEQTRLPLNLQMTTGSQIDKSMLLNRFQERKLQRKDNRLVIVPQGELSEMCVNEVKRVVWQLRDKNENRNLNLQQNQQLVLTTESSLLGQQKKEENRLEVVLTAGERLSEQCIKELKNVFFKAEEKREELRSNKTKDEDKSGDKSASEEVDKLKLERMQQPQTLQPQMLQMPEQTSIFPVRNN